MRGEDKKQSSMLVLMSPETRVPQTHPLRAIKKLADEALATLSPVFDAMYAEGGRPSIPPERLLKSMLLMALYTVRSERQFCEQLDYNLLFRWFLDMDMIEPSFVPTVFSHNRDRLIIHDVAGEFLRAIVEQARKGKLMSADRSAVPRGVTPKSLLRGEPVRPVITERGHDVTVSEWSILVCDSPGRDDKACR